MRGEARHYTTLHCTVLRLLPLSTPSSSPFCSSLLTCRRVHRMIYARASAKSCIYLTLSIAISCRILSISIKAELSLQAEAIALDLKVLWDTLSRNGGDSTMSPSSSSSSCTAWHSSSDQQPAAPIKTVLACQTFLKKLNRACVVFISWANELEENSVSLNDEIAKDKDIYRDTVGLRCVNRLFAFLSTRYSCVTRQSRADIIDAATTSFHDTPCPR